MQRDWKAAIWKGFRRRCPSCGEGALFKSYTRTNTTCPRCNSELHHHQADDAPAYFTIFAVGHIVVPAFVAVEKIWQPALWIHFALWLPIALVLTLWLLPRIKGALVGLQWALRMHGFGGTPEAKP